jgi:hypothetical protein
MGQVVDPDDIGLDLPDLHAAYLEAVRAIPDVARDQLIDARDPLTCTFIICDGKGRQLLEVPFTEVLPAAAWARRDRGRGPLSGGRSNQVRDDLALTGFRHMFSTVNVGCVLLTPELAVRAINDFGARHSHVDPDAIRGTSILDAFDLHGQLKPIPPGSGGWHRGGTLGADRHALSGARRRGAHRQRVVEGAGMAGAGRRRAAAGPG